MNEKLLSLKLRPDEESCAREWGGGGGAERSRESQREETEIVPVRKNRKRKQWNERNSAFLSSVLLSLLSAPLCISLPPFTSPSPIPFGGVAASMMKSFSWI